MQEVILYIQPQLRTGVTQDYVRADLMEPELITLTQVIQDVKEIDKIFTDYSRTFNLPASKKNNILFKRWYNPDIVGFDNQIMANARIELNHLAFKEGKIRLESVTMKHNQPSLYKVTFFGNTVSINNLIGEDKLSNLSWLDNFNYSQSNANVLTGLQNGIDKTVSGVTYTDAIIYPLIAHSQSFIYDTTNNQDNGLNIAVGEEATNLNRRGVLPEDLKPAITAKIIIKAIEQQYGITFKTGEFFDSAAMTNLYLWLHRNKGKLTAPNSKLVQTAFTCTSNTVNCNHFSSSQPPIFNGGNYIFSDVNTNNMPEGFTFQIQIFPTDNTQNYSIDIINELDGVVYGALENVQGIQQILVGFGQGYTTVNPINTNENFSIVARIRSDSTLTFDSIIDLQHFVFDTTLNSGTGGYNTFVAEFTQDANISTDASVVITDQIPEMKVIDFLKAFFSMHNLTSFLDFSGNVVVKTLDSFYSGGDTLDINEYVKTDTHSVSKTLPFLEIDFEYSEPKSILAQQFQTANNKKYGELNFVSDSSKGDTYKVEVPFEHMIFERLQDKTSEAFSTVQVGSFLDEDLNANIGAPLLFYAINQQNQNNINFLESVRPTTYAALCTAGTATVINDYWIPSMCNSLGTSSTAPTYNLNFGSEINTYTLTDYSGASNSLFQTYYQNYIVRVFNKRTRLFNYKAILPLNILLKLSLDDTIIIQERAFTINKMTTKLQSGETEFELLNEPT